MKILSIGNSYSTDAHRYLHRIATINGKELKCVNLCIGGCTLRHHYINLNDNEKSYEFQMNGESTKLLVSLKEVVKSDEWDVITLQQASHESFDINNYIPYIEKITEWIRLRKRNAKIFLHQTWAYPEQKERLREMVKTLRICLKKSKNHMIKYQRL